MFRIIFRSFCCCIISGHFDRYESTVIFPGMLIVVALVQIIVAHTALHALAEGAIRLLIGAIYDTDITAAEDVAVAVGNTGLRTDFAAVDVNLGLTEDVAIAIQCAVSAKVIVTATAAEDILVDMAAVHLDICLAWAVDALQHIVLAARLLLHLAATDGRDLAAAEETAAHMATVERYLGLIDIAVVNVTAAEQATGFCQQGVGRVLRVILDFLLVALVDVLGIGVILDFIVIT